MLFLVNWGTWHMQWWPTFPSLQSNLISCTWLLTGKNVAVRALCFSSTVLYYALILQKKKLVSGILWCNQSPAFSPLVPFLYCQVNALLEINKYNLEVLTNNKEFTIYRFSMRHGTPNQVSLSCFIRL